MFNLLVWPEAGALVLVLLVVGPMASRPSGISLPPPKQAGRQHAAAHAHGRSATMTTTTTTKFVIHVSSHHVR